MQEVFQFEIGGLEASLGDRAPSLPVYPFERLISSFMGKDRPVYILFHDDRFTSDLRYQSDALELPNGDMSSLITWWAGVPNYYILDKSFEFLIVANRYVLQVIGDAGVPRCFWDL
jgi:hypothetical protein